MKNLHALVVAAMLLVSLASHADSFTVSLNTSPVSGSTLILLFQFTGISDNSVVVDSLQYGVGGSAQGAATFTGGASANPGGGFSLTDSDFFFNSVEQQFVAGNSLSFKVNLTDNSDGFTPDEFAFSLEGVNTTDPGGALAVIDIGRAPLMFATSGNGNSSDQIGSPTITSAVPEPTTVVLLGTGLLILRWRRNHP
jgi:hypothetical protein